MPFVSIKPFLINYILLDIHGNIAISKNLRDMHFKGKRVGVFIDIENSLIGFKPNDDGFKLNHKTGRFSSAKIRKYGVRLGRYDAYWKKEHDMVIAKVELDSNES